MPLLLGRFRLGRFRLGRFRLGRFRLGPSPLHLSASHLLPAQSHALPQRVPMAGWFKPGCRMARWSPTIAAWLATRPSRPATADARIDRPPGIPLTGGRTTTYGSSPNSSIGNFDTARSERLESSQATAGHRANGTPHLRISRVFQIGKSVNFRNDKCLIVLPPIRKPPSAKSLTAG